MAASAGRSQQEQALLDKAGRLLPGGVLGGYSAPAELSFVVREARGARLTDVSGREYVDYILGSGPLVLGHAHPAVVSAVERQLGKGTTYFQLSEPTLELAEEICRAVPVRGANPVHVHRERGHVLRAPGRPRLPPAGENPEVRGRLPRHPRLFPDERGTEGAQGLPRPDAGLRRHSPRHPGARAGRAFQRPRRDRGHPGRAPRGPGRGHHGALPAPGAAGAGFPQGRAGDHERASACRSSSTRS